MKLAKREKILLMIAACCIGVVFIFNILIFPFFEKREKLKKGISARNKDLVEMKVKSVAHQTRKNSSFEVQAALARRKKSFTLFSFLDRAAGAAKVKEHIKYMKPSAPKVTGQYKELTVEMNLERITLDQLVGYLHGIESQEDFIIVKRISIKKNKKEPGYLDAIMQVLTFEK